MQAPKSLIARLRTRLVWWWERRSIPRLRDRIAELPPLACGRDADAELVIFTSPASLPDALWTARSVLGQLPTLPVCVALDGDDAALPTATSRLAQLLPGAECRTAESLVATCRPRLAAFARANAMGRKLAVVTARQRERAVLYSDSDVLAFAPLPEIAEAIASGAARHIQCVEGTCLDPVLHARTLALGLPLCPSLNGGFYLVPRGGFDESRIEEMLDGVDPAAVGWFGETTITAALMQALGSTALPRDRYVVSTQRQFVGEADVDYGRIALRHFVTPVRPLLYRRGMPLLWARWQSA